jgi:hypothetical protein
MGDVNMIRAVLAIQRKEDIEDAEATELIKQITDIITKGKDA